MKYKNIQQIENISEIKLELENVVKNIIDGCDKYKIHKENIFGYYKSALGYKIKYHQLLAKGYESAQDKEYDFLKKYDNIVNENMAEFRRWDKQIERNFKKFKKRIDKRII